MEVIVAAGVVCSFVAMGSSLYILFASGQAFSCPTHLGIKPFSSAVLPARVVNRTAAPTFFEAWLKYRASLRRGAVGGLQGFGMWWWLISVPLPSARFGAPLAFLLAWTLVADAHTAAVLRRSPVEEAFLKRARVEYDQAVRAH